MLGLLLMMAFGAFEWGMALRDWMSVTSGTREGARVGASAGDEPNADCLILEAAAGSLQAINDDQVIRVKIYKTDTPGTRVYPTSIGPPSPPTIPRRCAAPPGTR